MRYINNIIKELEEVLDSRNTTNTVDGLIDELAKFYYKTLNMKMIFEYNFSNSKYPKITPYYCQDNKILVDFMLKNKYN